MGDHLRAGIPLSYVTKPTKSTQPFIPLGSLNRVPALIGWGKGGNVTSAGWQVTLCDPIWHMSSCSGAVLVAQTATRFLNPYLLTLQNKTWGTEFYSQMSFLSWTTTSKPVMLRIGLKPQTAGLDLGRCDLGGCNCGLDSCDLHWTLSSSSLTNCQQPRVWQRTVSAAVVWSWKIMKLLNHCFIQSSAPWPLQLSSIAVRTVELWLRPWLL